MPWIIDGILLIIIVILINYKTNRITLDKTEAKNYQEEINRLKNQKQDLLDDVRAQTDLIQEYNDKILSIQNQYKKELNKKSDDLDAYFANQKQLRQSELDTYFETIERERKEGLDKQVLYYEQTTQKQIEDIDNSAKAVIEKLKQSQADIINATNFQEERFEALLAPLKQYEMDKQERLFYTIQVPDEYKNDIEFLLTTVAEKIQHPDVINKLVWTEYVKPYIDGTFKRVGIKDEPGIYKLTSLIDGKCYIGKSTNIKKRIADHMKSVVGISTIADQAVHHIIAREGYWNWTIEPIIYCDKDKLNELEKYYIDFFKSNEFGYNKTKGGEG